MGGDDSIWSNLIFLGNEPIVHVQFALAQVIAFE